MDIQKENELYSICPSFFSDAIACINHEKNEMDTCMAFGCECEDGWFEPLKLMAEKISIINKLTETHNYFFVCDQLKEKFAELNVYYSKRVIDHNKEIKNNEIIDKMMRETINSAAKDCWNVCEYCGEKQDIFENKLITTSGWMKRICKKCFFESKEKQEKINYFIDGYSFLNPLNDEKIYYEGNPYYNIWCAYYNHLIDDERIKEFFSSKVESGIIISIVKNFLNNYEENTELMKKILIEKFIHNKYKKQEILNIKNKEIIYNNTHHDNFWGNCTCEKCRKTIGLNNYGKILMDIVKDIKE